MKKETSAQCDSVIFEGMTSINAVLKASESGRGRKILRVWYDKSKKNAKRRELGFLKYASEKHGFDLIEADSEFIDKTALGNTHGGFLAECTERILPRLHCTSLLADDGFYIMIEGIEDPYNFGYALRTVYAAGADGVILTERNWMSAAGVVCRASAGASELFDTFVTESAEEAIKIFKEKSYKIVCAGIRDSVSIFDADMKKPLLLIIGGEKRGISSGVLNFADKIVRIDYGREFKGSLSAASAASVLAYEVFRQNRK